MFFCRNKTVKAPPERSQYLLKAPLLPGEDQRAALLHIDISQEKEVVSRGIQRSKHDLASVGAALVFFMQAGFSMCEAGFTRAKNTGNILMKNLMDFCIGTLLSGWWASIMFGSGTADGTIDPRSWGITATFFPRGFLCGPTPCSRRCSVPPLPPLFPGPWRSAPSSALTVSTPPRSP